MDLGSILVTVSVNAVPILMAITLHEVAHGRAARHFGDRTAEAQGRLSLNPLRHIDPVGTVLVPALLLALHSPFLFGWARPVPVNPRFMRRPRQDMVWVAAAGPASNIVMAIGWAIVLSMAQRGGGGAVALALQAMAWTGVWINLLLAVFNMLPIPPLDGGRVLANLMRPGPAVRLLERLEPWGLLIVLGLVVSGGLSMVLYGPMSVLADFILSMVGAQKS
jgi:Zn-dependent protease